MRSTNNDSTFPVTDWEIGVDMKHEVITIRFLFLAHLSQKMEQSDRSCRYVLSSNQCRDLIEKIYKQLHRLENAGPQGTPSDQTKQ
jgi:hypothetical protein